MRHRPWTISYFSPVSHVEAPSNLVGVYAISEHKYLRVPLAEKTVCRYPELQQHCRSGAARPISGS